MLDDSWVLRGQRRQHLVADSHAFEAPLMVRRIFDERELTLEDVRMDVLPATVDQRTNHAIGAPGFDRAEPTDSSSAKNPREHRLRLILSRMPDGDAVGRLRCSQLEKRSVP